MPAGKKFTTIKGKRVRVWCECDGVKWDSMIYSVGFIASKYDTVCQDCMRYYFIKRSDINAG